jgi:hypothetical protein
MMCEEAPTISTMSSKWTNEGFFSKRYRWTKAKAVPVTTLDNLITLYGLPKYCKIDVEGFEVQVLKGLSKPIRFISFEFHRWRSDDARKCIDRLLSIGNAEFNCVLGESMKFLFQKWVTPDELYKKIAEMSRKLDDTLLWGDIYAKLLQT